MATTSNRYETNVRRWLMIRGNVSRGVILTRKFSDRLAEKFIYCNLVMNTARGLDTLNGYWAAVGSCPEMEEYFELLDSQRVSPEYELEQNPWAKINSCLAYSAWCPDSPAGDLAFDIFDSLLKRELLPDVPIDPPQVCQDRSSAVTEAWKKWWDNSLQALIEYLTLWTRPRSFATPPRPILGDELFENVLPLLPLQELTWRKVQQTESCLRYLKSSTWSAPVSPSWIRRMTSRFLTLTLRGQGLLFNPANPIPPVVDWFKSFLMQVRGFVLSGEDRNNMLSVLDWFFQNGLWTSFGPKVIDWCSQLNTRPIWRTKADEAMEEWEELTNTLRPSGLVRLLVWRDVLAYPVYLNFFDFSKWQGMASSYGL